MSKMKLALRPDSTTPYRVGILDKKGKPKSVVIFEPNVPVEATAELIKHASHAIGGALVIVTESEEEEGKLIFDWQKTHEHAEKLGKEVKEPGGRSISVSPSAASGVVVSAPREVIPKGGKKQPKPRVIPPVPRKPATVAAPVSEILDNEEDKIELSDALMDVLVANADKHGDWLLAASTIKEHVDGGFDLKELDGLTDELSAELAAVISDES